MQIARLAGLPGYSAGRQVAVGEVIRVGKLAGDFNDMHSLGKGDTRV